MASGPRLRPSVVVARRRLSEGRAKLRRQHDNGSPGIQVCSHLTDLLDSIVAELYAAALGEMGDHDLESDIALIPNGGYGRRDVAPFSDVDLMLLTTPAASERAGILARHLTRDICDTGLKLGFSFRTPQEACSLALKDATIVTSLAESRLLAGSAALFHNFMARYRRRVARHWRPLVATILDSRKKERRQYGQTVYLLEPNVKRSRGGLRDLQLVRWIGFARYGQSDLESLSRLGALARLDRQRLLRSQEFLLRLRNEMHFHAGKSQDLLTRDEQVRLADWLKYEPRAKELPAERFMREYFEQTGDVRYVSAHFVASVRTLPKLRAAASTLFSHHVERDFRVGPSHISATRRGLAKVCGELAEVLRIMDLANMYSKRIDHVTWEAIRHAMAERQDAEISPEAVNRFLSLLSQPGRLADLLRRLHQLRVLERIIPAMQHARCLVQFNDYHKYTVDEHSIRAVECATEFVDDPGPVGVAYRELRNKRLLHLALLIHDLGKGYDDDHSEVGVLIAADTAARLSLSEADTDTLKFLVGKHLRMTHVALRQDLRDESVVVRLAVEVGSPEVLQMLYVLSCADLAAVGPGVLTNWKLELLTELYHRTHHHLTADEPAGTDAEVQRYRRAVRKIAAGAGELPRDDWWHRQIEALPAEYLLSVSADRIYQVLKRLRQLGRNDVTAWSRYVPERKVTIYLVGAYESITPGVFHKLTGALTGKGLEILSAEIHTLADGMVLDRFYIHDTDFAGEPPAERTQEVCDALVAALTTNADKPPAFRRLWQAETGSAAARFSELPTQIRFDDTTSDQFSIITIFAYDRRGLLYNVARTLFESGLSVHVAKIATYLDQVVDVFYVTDFQGRKIYDDRLRADVRRRLTEALEPNDTETVTPRQT